MFSIYVRNINGDMNITDFLRECYNYINSTVVARKYLLKNKPYTRYRKLMYSKREIPKEGCK